MTHEEQICELAESEAFKLVTNIRFRSLVPYYDAVRIAIYMAEKLYSEEIMFKNGDPEPEYFWPHVINNLKSQL